MGRAPDLFNDNRQFVAKALKRMGAERYKVGRLVFVNDLLNAMDGLTGAAMGSVLQSVFTCFLDPVVDEFQLFEYGNAEGTSAGYYGNNGTWFCILHDT